MDSDSYKARQRSAHRGYPPIGVIEYMSHEQQNEWPSFETVLRDVAPDSPTARSLASADERAHYAETAEEIRARTSAGEREPSVPSSVDVRESRSATSSKVERKRALPRGPIAKETSSGFATELPGPLEPIELDTSSIRELLERADTAIESVELEALAPLPEVPELTLDEITVVEDDKPTIEDDKPTIEDDKPTIEDDEPTIEELFVEEPALEESTVFEPVVEEPDFEALAAVEEPVVEEPEFEALAAVEEPVVEEPEFDELADTTEFMATEDDLFSETIPDVAASEVVAAENTEPEAFDGQSGFFTGDDSLVFELDDAAITSVDEAFESDFTASPVELADPHHDEQVDQVDAFSEIDTPPLTESEVSVEDSTPSLDSSLDRPFEGLENPFEDIGFDTIEPAVATNDPDVAVATGEIDLFALETPEADVDVDELELAVDETSVFEPVELSIEQVEPLPEMADEADDDDLQLDAQIIELPTDGFPDFDLVDDSEPSTFDTAPIDLFDLNTDSQTIEADRINLDGIGSADEGFDAVAAADAIETDLDSLFELPEQASTTDGTASSASFDDMAFGQLGASEDNVIPLHPEAEQTSAPASNAASPKQTDWVSLPAAPTADAAPEAATSSADPWAYMRPSEEPKKKGFWANRPRFFGGDKRRKARDGRETTTTDQETAHEMEEIDKAVGVSFDKECPNCGDECQVDLDDPVGRRVHVSCPSCKHIWYTPYLIDDSQTG